jgi:hypothetical protein
MGDIGYQGAVALADRRLRRSGNSAGGQIARASALNAAATRSPGGVETAFRSVHVGFWTKALPGGDHLSALIRDESAHRWKPVREPAVVGLDRVVWRAARRGCQGEAISPFSTAG